MRNKSPSIRRARKVSEQGRREKRIAMKKILAQIGLMMLLPTLCTSGDVTRKVLILYDEKPQMEILAKRLKAESYGVDFVSTKEKLPTLDPYYAVAVFIHSAFPNEQADAIIRYTRAGGRMIALHHTISSAKVKTPEWLKFLGIELKVKGDILKGGYVWQEGVDLRLVNLAPSHYITTQNIKYKEKVEYKRSDVDEPAKQRDCVDFPDSEVYINHTFADAKDRTVLYGFVCRHAKLGEKTWMQDRGGWLKKSDKGWIFYFMPGHTVAELENPIFQQVILNCLTWNP
jgi:type 1 glutamine amidotransferase